MQEKLDEVGRVERAAEIMRRALRQLLVIDDKIEAERIVMTALVEEAKERS